jgi:hypothetical protein
MKLPQKHHYGKLRCFKVLHTTEKSVKCVTEYGELWFPRNYIKIRNRTIFLPLWLVGKILKNSS